MKRAGMMLCGVMAAFVVIAWTATDLEKQREAEINGAPKEFSIAAGRILSDTYSGNLTAASPTWDRIYACNVSTSCSAICTDSSQNGVYYDVIPIEVTAVENLECAVTASSMSDTIFFLYCDPFNPAAPMTNVVASDDDDGTGSLSAFTAADGITLQPGQTYYLVVSPFYAGVSGTFTVDFTSATVHVVPVELQSFSAE